MDRLETILFQYRRARRLIVERWVETRDRSLTDACKDCPSSYCCAQLPLSHPMEGLVASAYLVQQGRGDEVALARRQGVEQYELWRKDFPRIEQAKTMEEASRLVGVGAEEWFKRHEPCVFLKEGRCSIYLVRPVMCSTYYVQTRCTRWIGADELVPTADNFDVVAAVMALSDEALSELTNTPGTMAAPLPFAYAVSVGAALLAGKRVPLRETPMPEQQR